MAISRTLAKHRERHLLKAPCLHLSQIGTSIIKKLKERAFKPPREAARSFNSLEFCFEIWERESAPAELMLRFTAIYGRLLSEAAAKHIDC